MQGSELCQWNLSSCEGMRTLPKSLFIYLLILFLFCLFWRLLPASLASLRVRDVLSLGNNDIDALPESFHGLQLDGTLDLQRSLLRN